VAKAIKEGCWWEECPWFADPHWQVLERPFSPQQELETSQAWRMPELHRESKDMPRRVNLRMAAIPSRML